MRRVATAAILAIATIVGAHNSASAQTVAPNNPPVTTRVIPTPLGWYVMGGIACAAVSPIIATVVLGRELTATEGGRSSNSSGPAGTAHRHSCPGTAFLVPPVHRNERTRAARAAAAWVRRSAAPGVTRSRSPSVSRVPLGRSDRDGAASGEEEFLLPEQDPL